MVIILWESSEYMYKYNVFFTLIHRKSALKGETHEICHHRFFVTPLLFVLNRLPKNNSNFLICVQMINTSGGLSVSTHARRNSLVRIRYMYWMDATVWTTDKYLLFRLVAKKQGIRCTKQPFPLTWFSPLGKITVIRIHDITAYQGMFLFLLLNQLKVDANWSD